MRKRILAGLAAALLVCLAAAGCFLPASAPASTPAPTACLNLIEGEETLPEVAEDGEPSPSPEEALAPSPTEEQDAPKEAETPSPLEEHGVYTSRDDVALFLHMYGRLPDNFITKKEAQALGWSGGGLDAYAYGKCIGGTFFGNYEGLLPSKAGRSYYECDIGTLHKDSRGAKRIVFSNDGLIYYTEDHYNSFTLLYGED